MEENLKERIKQAAIQMNENKTDKEFSIIHKQGGH